jgi:hypothetical protein
MTRASGLTLKSSKCVIIPTAFDISEENIACLREWLGLHIPESADMQIRSKGKYLGLYLGPGTTPSTNWEGPQCKFVERVSQLSDQGLPLGLRANIFASKAVSVSSYVAQVQEPPPKFKVIELRMASKALGLATSAFCTNTAYQLGKFGGPQLTRPRATMHAARIRAALKTFQGFEASFYGIFLLKIPRPIHSQQLGPSP